ncbi:MAG: hypothetical protein GX557_06710 [Chloroflexi bacterium]|nr:hypothetical protein [Chloroflexota bacterium]
MPTRETGEPMDRTQPCTAPARARASAVRRATEALLRLSRGALTAPLDDLSVIEAELRQLYAARGVLAAWARDVWAVGGCESHPGQLLRAWSDAVRQVLLLLRARRDLAESGAAAALEEEARRVLEELPGLRQLAGQAHPADADEEPR